MHRIKPHPSTTLVLPQYYPSPTLVLPQYYPSTILVLEPHALVGFVWADGMVWPQTTLWSGMLGHSSPPGEIFLRAGRIGSGMLEFSLLSRQAVV